MRQVSELDVEHLHPLKLALQVQNNVCELGVLPGSSSEVLVRWHHLAHAIIRPQHLLRRLFDVGATCTAALSLGGAGYRLMEALGGATVARRRPDCS